MVKLQKTEQINMALNQERLNSFFKGFPFCKKVRPKVIDFHFFETAIPKIISDKLNLSISPPNLNIFEGFNLGENELKHCSVLSWFLNPRANHCQGQLFLDIFLKEFGMNDLAEYIKGGYFSVSTEDTYSENGRVDITISSSQFWIIVEAKISANEQSDQISRYQDILEKKSQALGIPMSRCKLIFLTRDGRNPLSGESDFSISWKDISRVLNTFSSICNNEYVSLTAKQYANFITTHI